MKGQFFTFSPKLGAILMMSIFLISILPVTSAEYNPYDIGSVFVKRTDGTTVSHRGTVYNPNDNNLVKGDQWVVAVTVDFHVTMSSICLQTLIKDNFDSPSYDPGEIVSYWTPVKQYTGKSAGQSHTYWIYYDAMMRDYFGQFKALGEGQWMIGAVYIGHPDASGSCDSYPGSYYEIIGQPSTAIANAKFEVWDTNSDYSRTIFVLQLRDWSMSTTELDSALELTNNDFLDETDLNIRFMHMYAGMDWITETWSKSTVKESSEILDRAIDQVSYVLGTDWTSISSTWRDNDKYLYLNMGFDILFATFDYPTNEFVAQGSSRTGGTENPYDVWGGNLAYAATGIQGIPDAPHDRVIKHEMSHLFGALDTMNILSIMGLGYTDNWVSDDIDNMSDYLAMWDTNFDTYIPPS